MSGAVAKAKTIRKEVKKMFTYETIIIFNGNLSVEKYNTLVTKYADHIMSLGGKIETTNKLGKKKLAYPMKETTDGWYVLFTYHASPDLIPKLECIMREDDDVIKFLSIKRDETPDSDSRIAAKSEQPNALDVLLGIAKYSE